MRENKWGGPESFGAHGPSCQLLEAMCWRSATAPGWVDSQESSPLGMTATPLLLPWNSPSMRSRAAAISSKEGRALGSRRQQALIRAA